MKLLHFIDCSFLTTHSQKKVILFPYSTETLTSDLWVLLILFFSFCKHDRISKSTHFFILLKLVFLPMQMQKSTYLEGRALQLKLVSSITGIKWISVLSNLILERELYMYMNKSGWKEAEFRRRSLNVSFDEYSSYELNYINFLT